MEPTGIWDFSHQILYKYNSSTFVEHIYTHTHTPTLYSTEREEMKVGELGKREERKKKFASNSNNPQVSHNTTHTLNFLIQIHAHSNYKQTFQMCFDGILVLKMKGVEP